MPAYFKKFDGKFAMIDYLHEHIPKQLPILVKKVPDQFVKRIKEALTELDARISILEELYDNEYCEDEDTLFLTFFEAHFSFDVC